MYYLLYGFLYLLSLLPFFILYRISDLAFFFIYHVAGYRKNIVADNLQIAFPEKSPTDRTKIAKQFYQNLADNFIETIKLLSLSESRFAKRASIDFTGIGSLEEKGLNIQFHSGHQMNWEFASLAISRSLTIPWLAVYMRINTRALDRLFLKIRSRFGTTMVGAQTFKSQMPNLMKKQYALGLIADQNPPGPQSGYWLHFFSKPAPFLIGPEKGAVRNKTAVVFVNIIKVKRGYYHFDCRIITESAGNLSNGQLTALYRDFLEEGIRKHPDNYLWSHRRWKFNWDNAFEKKWIDNRPHP